MICAPSNAAIDHITRKIIDQGIVNYEKSSLIPNLIRFGAVESEDETVKCVSFYSLLDEIFELKKNYEMLTRL